MAESEALAADGAQMVEVELEPLEPVLNVEAAAAPGAPRARVVVADEGKGSDIGDAHAAVAAGGLEDEDLSDNLIGAARLTNGDVGSGLAASKIVVRGRFTTPWMYQGYLEPQTATAWLEPDGELIVTSATQAPFAMLIIEPLVCSAALLLRRPVRLAMTRSEDIAAANPAGAEVMYVEIGATAEGQLTGIRARTFVDRGSTNDYGVESIAAMLAAGPYNGGAHELSALGVATNRVTFGAYRAPTAAPAAFALECLIDDLARRLDVDPLEFSALAPVWNG